MRGHLIRLALLLPVLLLASCREPMAVPAFDSRLEAWDAGAAAPRGVRIHAFRTGAMRSVEAVAWEGGSWTTPVSMPAWGYVVEHPDLGMVVFDAGLPEGAHANPGKYVGWLGARLHILDVPEGAGLATQMRAAGLDPAKVSTVVLSHLHFDHTGAVRDFPGANVFVGAGEKQWLADGVRRTDFVDVEAVAGIAKWKAVDFSQDRPLATFPAAHDLTGDGSLWLVDLSGHTPGSVGLLVRTSSGPVLLAGDAAWTTRSWRWPARPIAAKDMQHWWEQAWRIKRFAMLEPRLVVVPGHDDDAVAAAAAAGPSFVVHALPAARAAAAPR